MDRALRTNNLNTIFGRSETEKLQMMANEIDERSERTTKWEVRRAAFIRFLSAISPFSHCLPVSLCGFPSSTSTQTMFALIRLSARHGARIEEGP